MGKGSKKVLERGERKGRGIEEREVDVLSSTVFPTQTSLIDISNSVRETDGEEEPRRGRVITSDGEEFDDFPLIEDRYLSQKSIFERIFLENLL